MNYRPYPRRRRIYVRTLYILLRTHKISLHTFAANLRAVMGAYRED